MTLVEVATPSTAPDLWYRLTSEGRPSQSHGGNRHLTAMAGFAGPQR